MAEKGMVVEIPLQRHIGFNIFCYCYSENDFQSKKTECRFFYFESDDIQEWFI
jgi:hypothetical protein